MKVGILTDLKSWFVERLMGDLRKQFAYSVALFVLIAVLLGFAATFPDESNPALSPVHAVVLFGVLELGTWFSFVRVWRELGERLKADAARQ